MTAWTSLINEVPAMETIFYTVVPKIYMALRRWSPKYACEQRYVSAKTSGVILYKCLSCNADFEVYHRWINMNRSDETMVFCPVCGELLHSRLESWANYKDCSNLSEWVPVSAYLTVQLLRDGVKLNVSTRSMFMDGDRDLVRNIRETFFFDIRNRRTVFKQTVGRHAAEYEMELGNVRHTEVYNESLLRHLNRTNLSAEFRGDLINLMRCLRAAVQKKWKEIHGYKLSGIYSGYGEDYGYLLLPLFNIAYRLVYADAPNLPIWMGSARACMELDDHFEDPIPLDRIRRANTYVDAMVEELDDIRPVRKLLLKDPFAFGRLKKLREMFRDPNHYVPLYCMIERRLPESYHTYYMHKTRGWEEFLDNSRYAFAGRDGREVRHWLAKCKDWTEVRDIGSMLHDMPPVFKAKARKVKLKELHDWLVTQQAVIKHEGFALDVPEHIVRRFQMQADQVKFYLPEHSSELMKGGKLMHNCVGTYGRRVANGECNIVYMTDDNGKLTACLEVRDNSLVQAKLKYNKPVSLDPVINDAIIDWCKKAKLTVDTEDVNTHTDEKEVREAV